MPLYLFSLVGYLLDLPFQALTPAFSMFITVQRFSLRYMHFHSSSPFERHS